MGSPSGSGAVVKTFFRGTHRVVDPRQTVERVRRLMPALGITRMANITGLDSLGIPTVAVYRPNSRSLSVAQGKGLSLAAAQASGLMEALEHHHAERILRPLLLATWRELKAARRVVEVNGLVAASDRLFHENHQLLWIDGVDLLNEESVWVPYECVHLDFTVPSPSGAGCFAQTSNGLASGNHFLEAVSHGICEVVERDAYSRFLALSAEEQGRHRVDLSTVEDKDCRGVLERYAAAGVAVGIWELGSPTRVPAFRCEIVDREDSWRSLGASGGLGCHPLPQIALLRALTEAAQSRLTVISGARDDLDFRQEERIRGQDVVKPIRRLLADGAFGLGFGELPEHAFETFEQEIAWLLERLRDSTIRRAVAVDLTHPGLGIPVVRMVVPFLLGIPPH